MATREQLREMITAAPFLPFAVKLASGRSLSVTHPELASCSVDGRSMWIHDNDGVHLVDMLLVEVMEPIRNRVAESVKDEDTAKLLEALRAAPGGLTTTQINRQFFGGHKTSASLNEMLMKCLSEKSITRERESSGGRRLSRYFAT